MPGTGGAAPSQPPASPTPIRDADATLASAHRGAMVIPGAQGYNGTPGRSHTPPTANPQTFAHVAVTFRPRHICTGITESGEISWLGQAWLSATQFSPAAYKAIYAGLPTTRPDGFWTAFPIDLSFRNTMIPPQPGTEWPGSETLPGAGALPSYQLAGSPKKL